MEVFHRDDLRHGEIFSKLQEKEPYLGFCILLSAWTSASDLTTLKICVQSFLFGTRMTQKYTTYLRFGHMSKISCVFLMLRIFFSSN